MQLEPSPRRNTVGVNDEIKSYHGVSRAPDGPIFWENVSTNSRMKVITSQAPLMPAVVLCPRRGQFYWVEDLIPAVVVRPVAVHNVALGHHVKVFEVKGQGSARRALQEVDTS